MPMGVLKGSLEQLWSNLVLARKWSLAARLVIWLLCSWFSSCFLSEYQDRPKQVHRCDWRVQRGSRTLADWFNWFVHGPLVSKVDVWISKTAWTSVSTGATSNTNHSKAYWQEFNGTLCRPFHQGRMYVCCVSFELFWLCWCESVPCYFCSCLESTVPDLFVRMVAVIMPLLVVLKRRQFLPPPSPSSSWCSCRKVSMLIEGQQFAPALTQPALSLLPVCALVRITIYMLEGKVKHIGVSNFGVSREYDSI